MAKYFDYKKVTTTKIKAVGEFNLKDMTINVDGDEIKISDLLRDFDGTTLVLAANLKEEEELEL